jgi:ATP-binding cassette subfamily B protein
VNGGAIGATATAVSPPVDPPPAKEVPFGWRERWRAAPEVGVNAWRALGLVARADRSLLVQLLAGQLLDAVLTVSITAVGPKIIDAIVGRAPRAALTWVVLELLLVLAKTAATQWNIFTGVMLRSRLGLHVNLLILRKAANVSYPHFEDPAFINQLTQARREATARPVDLVNQLMVVLRSAVTLVGYAALLSQLGPWALVVLVLTGVPPFIAETRHGRELFALQRARTQRNRQGAYLETTLTTESTVKEVKLLGLSQWIIDRYRVVHEGFHLEEVALHRRRARWSVALSLLSSVAFYLAYVSIVRDALAGAITLGAMTLYLMVFRQGQSSMQSALSGLARIYEDNLFMANLFEFLGMPDDEPDAAPVDGADTERPPEVRFEHVSFRYPGAERDALTDVSLTLHPGETVALVGRNGAGKTTLVKLLTGLHRPTSGRILLDGVDLATMPAHAFRARLAVVLQDFARFQFSVAENIGVGWLPAREDRGSIERSVRDAGADELVARLPKGLDTPLGRAFGGDDLSVGQWQRVALARAFMRRSGLLVLDEPTAALDAEAEHEVFERLQALKATRTAVLITHRFSTVRMADRIVVVDGGRITEEGPHAALIARGGTYATLFNLQAEGYREMGG